MIKDLTMRVQTKEYMLFFFNLPAPTKPFLPLIPQTCSLLKTEKQVIQKIMLSFFFISPLVWLYLEKLISPIMWAKVAVWRSRGLLL